MELQRIFIRFIQNILFYIMRTIEILSIRIVDRELESKGSVIS